jgi:hypothetical protein
VSDNRLLGASGFENHPNVKSYMYIYNNTEK